MSKAAENQAKGVPEAGDAPRVIVVTGLSGAGRSSALNVFEDIGYEAVDNLPLSLLGALIRPDSGFHRPLAVGIDRRTRNFDVERFLDEYAILLDEAVAMSPAVEVKLLFMDCDDVMLQRRFTETRRRHPMYKDRPVTDGIRGERRLVRPLRERADVVIDTTDYQLSDLKNAIELNFAVEKEPGMALSVLSFSFRSGLPRDADLVFDVRFLVNPHYEDSLKLLTGRDQPVQQFIEADRDFGSFFDHLTDMLRPLLPRFDAEGKSYLTIAVGCTGGRHRSVFVAEKLAAWLRSEDWRVRCHHRDVSRTPAPTHPRP